MIDTQTPVLAAESTDVLIVGTGFSGLALACALREAGRERFLLLDKADQLGGTWRDNRYPGAECDVPSALYSFSFAHNAAWHYKWAEQPQILRYLRHVAEAYGLPAHMRFGAEVRALRWDDTARRWRVECGDGRSFDARVVVSAVGQLHHPALPDLPGAGEFRGLAFHSARWPDGVDLSGKRVVVIGNAASAVQFVPQIAPRAARVTVFQRSANWVLPKRDRVYLPIERWLWDKLPWLHHLYRLRVWLFGELFLYAIMRGNRLLSRWATNENRRYLERSIADPALRRQLTPDYPVGAKRVLFSDDYYAALARPNVELVTSGVERLTAGGVLCRDGREIAADAIVYGTGFRTNPFLDGIDVVGSGGRRLRDAWAQGAQAYLGMTTAGFPNLFLMYGPNTNLGHNSIVIMSEAQARYIVRCLDELDRRGAATIAVRPEVEARYNVEMQTRLRDMVWSRVGASWYQDRGRITNNWPGSTFEYLRRLRRPDFNAYLLNA